MAEIVINVDTKNADKSMKKVDEWLKKLEDGVSIKASFSEESLANISSKIKAIKDEARKVTIEADLAKTSFQIENVSLKESALNTISTEISKKFESINVGLKIDPSHIRNEVANAIKEAVKQGSAGIAEDVNKALTQKGKLVKLNLDLQNVADQITRALAKKGVIKVTDIGLDRQKLIASVEQALHGHTFMINVGVDQKQALQAVQQAMANLNGSSGQTANNTGKISENMGNAAKHGRALSDQMKTTTQLATLLGNSIGNLFGAYQVKGFLEDIVKIGGELEKQKLAMASIMGDSYKAQETYSKVARLSMISPFDVEDLLKYTKQLNAFGIKYNELYDTTKRLSDIAAAVGVSFGRIAYEYGQTSARGWLDGRELRMFANSGIPLLQKLADHYSKLRNEIVTTAQVRKMVTNRQVSFEDVKAVLWQMTDAGGEFYEMQEVMAESLAAKWRNLGNAWNLMLGRFAEGTTGNMLKWVAEELTLITESFENVTAVMMGAVPAAALYALAMRGVAVANATASGAIAETSGVTLKQIGVFTAWKTALMGFWRGLVSMITNPFVIVGAIMSAVAWAVSMWSEREKEIERVDQALRDRTNDGLRALEELDGQLKAIFGSNNTYGANIKVNTEEAIAGVEAVAKAAKDAEVSPEVVEETVTKVVEKPVTLDNAKTLDAFNERLNKIFDVANAKRFERQLENVKAEIKEVEDAIKNADFGEGKKFPSIYEANLALGDLRIQESTAESLVAEYSGLNIELSETEKRFLAMQEAASEATDAMEAAERRIEEIGNETSKDELDKDIANYKKAIARYEQMYNDNFLYEEGETRSTEQIEAEGKRLAALIEQEKQYLEEDEKLISTARPLYVINQDLEQQKEVIAESKKIIEEYEKTLAEMTPPEEQPRRTQIHGIHYSTIEDSPNYNEYLAEQSAKAILAAHAEGSEQAANSIEQSATEAVDEVSNAAAEGTKEVVVSISKETTEAIKRMTAAQRKSIKDSLIDHLKDYDPNVNNVLNEMNRKDSNGEFVHDEIEQLALLKQAYDDIKKAYESMPVFEGILTSANKGTGTLFFDDTMVENLKDVQDQESEIKKLTNEVMKNYVAISEAVTATRNKYPQLVDWSKLEGKSLEEQVEVLRTIDAFRAEVATKSHRAATALANLNKGFSEMHVALDSANGDISQFADSVESILRSKGFEWITGAGKKAVKVQLDAFLNTEGITSEAAKQLVFQEFVKRKMIVETEVLNEDDGEAPLTDIQKSALKAIEGLNTGASSEESKALYEKLQRDIIAPSPTRTDLAQKVRDRMSKAKQEQKAFMESTEEYKALEAEIEALQAIADATQIRTDNVKGSSASKGDPELDKWKERVKFYREAYQEYKKWYDLYHDENLAIAKTKENPLYSGEDFNPKEVRDNLEGIADEIAANKEGNDKRAKYEVEVRGIISGIDYDFESQDFKAALEKLREGIAKETKQWQMFDKIFATTGDEGIAIKYAFGDTKIWDKQAKVLYAQFENAVRQLPDKDLMESILGDGEAIFDMSFVDAKDMFGEGEVLEYWKRTKEVLENGYSQMVTNVAEHLNQVKTIAEQVGAIMGKYRPQIEAARVHGDTKTEKILIQEQNSELVAAMRQRYSAEWSQSSALEELGARMTNAMRTTLGEMQKYMATNEFKNSNPKEKQEFYAAYQKMLKDSNSWSFGDVSEKLTNLTTANKELKAAQNKAIDAQKKLTAATLELEEAESKPKEVKEAAQNKLRTATAENNSAQEELQKATSNQVDKQNEANIALQNFKTGLENISSVATAIKNKSASGLVTSVDKMIRGIDAARKGLHALEKGAQESGNVYAMIIAAILEILEQIGREGLGQLVKDLIEVIGEAINGILSNILSGNFFKQIGEAIVSLIANVLDGITVGGFSSWTNAGDSDKDYEKDMSYLTLSNENLRKAIDNLADIMDDQAATDAKATYEMITKNFDSMTANKQEQMQRSQRASSNGFLGIGGHHSSGYRINKGMSVNEWNEISRVVGKSVRGAGDFFNLTSEEMWKVATYATSAYTHLKDLADDGYQDAAQYMDEYIGYWKELQDAWEDFFEAVTGVSFDSMFDAFKDLIKDLDATAEDFAESFEKYLFDAIVNAQSAKILQPMMDEFAHKFADAMSNDNEIDAQERAILKKMWDDMAQKGEEIRKLAQDESGYGKDKNVGGLATSIEGITAEQADILAAYLNGIRLDCNAIRMMFEYLTYEQMESIYDTLDAQLNVLNNISNFTSRTADAVEVIQETLADLSSEMHSVVTGTRSFSTTIK